MGPTIDSLIPTEPIGSIPRPPELRSIEQLGPDSPQLDALYDAAINDTVEKFEATGSPVITDGEQRKYHNFWTYSVHGAANTAPDGFAIPFAAGHTRRMPRLTRGPFRYLRHADSYLDVARRYARVPLKQAVISPSALSLMYPAEGIPGYTRDEFIHDLLAEHEREIRACFAKGAVKVQVDFTEGRLAMKIDPSGDLLTSFIDLNNLALSRFSPEDRARIGIHTCPGGDRDSTHSADVDYAELHPPAAAAPALRPASGLARGTLPYRRAPAPRGVRARRPRCPARPDPVRADVRRSRQLQPPRARAGDRRSIPR